MIVESFIFIFIFVLLLIFWKRTQRPLGFPPGPRPWPFFGNMIKIGLEPHNTLFELSKKYGAIVGLTFGPKLVICLHGTDLIKEAFNLGSFAGRGTTEATYLVAGDEMGIVNSVGDTWTEQRRFTLRHLRDFGFGKNFMEDLIMDEVKDFIQRLKVTDSRPVPLQHRFSLAVINSLWRILTGERFDHDDYKLHKILEDLERATKIVFGFDNNLFIFFYPKIGQMFSKWSGWKILEEFAQQRKTIFDRIIHEHEETLEIESPRDFVDVFLSEIQRTTDKSSSFHSETSGVRSLRSVMADFFIAGTDTTAVTLSWLNLYLLHYPRVQRKLHAELDRVIGPSRFASLTDRKSLPYTKAVVLETLRLSSIAALSIPHAATEDTIFHGYEIPKGTMIFANLYANHHDPAIWGNDVEEFKPERFLNKDESILIKNEAFIPFSIGKRACPGETLVKDTVFLFAANLALHFQVEGIPGQPLPPLDYKRGQLSLAPICDVVVMKERKIK